MNRLRMILLIGLAASLALLPVSCKKSSGRAREVMCGGPMNYTCPAAWYCKLKENCGGIDGEGFCELRPDKCTSELKPVCGCDGRTYSNQCFAAVAGVSAAREGRCEPDAAKEDGSPHGSEEDQ